MSRRFVVSFLIANLIGIVFLWLALRGLPFGELLEVFSEPSRRGDLLVGSLACVAIYSVCHAARVVRWYDLLRPLGPIEPRTAHRVCVVGLTAILLLPLRLGEVVRPYLLSRRTEIPMMGALGTAVVERVVDGLLVTGLLFATLSTYSGPAETGFVRGAGLISAAIFVPASLICVLALWRRDLALMLVETLAGLVHRGLAEKLAGLLESFIDGFQGLLRSRAALRYLAITAIYWGANIASMWALAQVGFGMELGLWEMATVLSVLVIGIMIPAGPAMAGNFEYFVSRGVGLFVVAGAAGVEARIMAFAATLHILQFVVIAVPGFVVMWTDPQARHLIRLSRQGQEITEEEAG
jgi:hypothetical protein